MAWFNLPLLFVLFKLSSHLSYLIVNFSTLFLFYVVSHQLNEHRIHSRTYTNTSRINNQICSSVAIFDYI